MGPQPAPHWSHAAIQTHPCGPSPNCLNDNALRLTRPCRVLSLFLILLYWEYFFLFFFCRITSDVSLIYHYCCLVNLAGCSVLLRWWPSSPSEISFVAIGLKSLGTRVAYEYVHSTANPPWDYRCSATYKFSSCLI